MFTRLHESFIAYRVKSGLSVHCLQQQQQQAQQQAQQQQQQQQQQVGSPGSGNVGKGSPSPGNSSSPGTVATANKSQTEPKPVECNLCHRKFKNIPALNGHMRLHGGYFKKVNFIFDKDTVAPVVHVFTAGQRTR